MTTVPLSQYLGSIYHPDCDYLEGVLEERNVGEVGHSEVQSALITYLRYERKAFWSGVEGCVQVKAERFRIPDVTIVRGGKPAGRIITSPPEVAVEVLSPEDRASSIQDRIDDYFAFGIPCVWVINPDTQRAWIHTPAGSHEVRILRNAAGDPAVPLNALFPE